MPALGDPAQYGDLRRSLGCSATIETPFYDLVPKDMIANLKFRREMVSMGSSDQEAARELWIMCSRDPLFWFNTFAWTYDPRRFATSSSIPFITYPFQDAVIAEIISAIGSHDLIIEKSRDMGASYMAVGCCGWFATFRDESSFLFLSRKEDLVDSSDPDSMFWKWRFISDNMPGWLKPTWDCTHLRMKADNGATVKGESANKDAGRAGRYTAAILDETAAMEYAADIEQATGSTSNSRIFVSTHKGPGTVFHELIKKGGTRCVTTHWSHHPDKSRGMYISRGGKLLLLDPSFKGKVKLGKNKYAYPDDYPFIMDDKIRSPFYDNECMRALSKANIAQELDIDPEGSGYQFFDSDQISKCEKEYAIAPFSVGEIEYDRSSATPAGFSFVSSGRMKLWTNLDEKRRPSSLHRYAVGADIAMGTGASNSALVVGDMVTKEKVAEFICSTINPEDFGTLAVAVCRWFGDAYMIWEANGPGRGFGAQVMALNYRNIYFRRNEESVKGKIMDFPGWWTSPQSKLALLGELRRASAEGEFVNRSVQALEEQREYVYQKNGSGVEFSSSLYSIDPSGRGESHGDIVIADALLWHAMKSVVPKQAMRVTIPPDSLAARLQEYEKDKRDGELLMVEGASIW